MVEASGKHVWVGITDREKEGVYRYVNGQGSSVSRGKFFLYYYAPGEPSNARGVEDCVHYYRATRQLNDADCGWGNYEGADFHGLCEIKN